MFHPLDHPLERGWVGRIDGDRVIHLAAQTLQSFFTGGGAAREHAEYPLADVCFLPPVLHPPSVRVFESQDSFAFANPTAILGPSAKVAAPGARVPGNSLLRGGLELLPRIAGVIGADGVLAGFTAFSEWRDPSRVTPKDRDFALGLGPVVVTPDELVPEGLEAIVRVDGEERLRGRLGGYDWEAGRDFAAEGTVLRPGDLLAGPALGGVDDVPPGSLVELQVEPIGTLRHSVA